MIYRNFMSNLKHYALSCILVGVWLIYRRTYMDIDLVIRSSSTVLILVKIRESVHLDDVHENFLFSSK